MKEEVTIECVLGGYRVKVGTENDTFTNWDDAMSYARAFDLPIKRAYRICSARGLICDKGCTDCCDLCAGVNVRG